MVGVVWWLMVGWEKSGRGAILFSILDFQFSIGRCRAGCEVEQ